MVAVTKEEAKQPMSLREIRNLDDSIRMGITRARTGWAIIDVFLHNLHQHILGKDTPMVNALRGAAIDSVIISLGRLLRPRPEEKEFTLLKYLNSVTEYLKYDPVRNKSDRAKESLKKLQDVEFVKQLKVKQQQYFDQVKLWRDKVTAHNEIGTDVCLPKNLPEIIKFVENVHSICLSAMEDSSMEMGPYLSDAFESISEDWVNCLSLRFK